MNEWKKWVPTSIVAKMLVLLGLFVLPDTAQAVLAMKNVSESGDVRKEGDFKYSVNSPTTSIKVVIKKNDAGGYRMAAYYPGGKAVHHPLNVPDGKIRPVLIRFQGWKCGTGVDKLYLHARAVIRHAREWPRETLEKLLYAIAEGKATKSKVAAYNVMAAARRFLEVRGASFDVKVSPEIVVPSPGSRKIDSCYTTSEIMQIIDSVEQAVRQALQSSQSNKARM